MKAQTKWLLLLVLLIVVLVGGGMVYQQLKDQYQVDNLQTATPSEEDHSSEEKMAIPNFELQDWEGNPVEFSSFLGKPVIINFWASWCPNCAEQLVVMQSIYEEYEDRVTFFMVNVTDGVKETITDGKDYIADKGYTFPVYYDINLQASSAYGASSIPITYLIDADGNIAAYGMGTLNEEVIKSYLDGLVE